MSRRIPAARISVQRVRDGVSPGHRVRLLVDRLWPRGVTQDEAAVDFWLKDLAPSNSLRRWFGHDPRRWIGFCRRYRAELAQQSHALARVRHMARAAPLVLVFAARDAKHNNAVALRRILLGRPIA